MKVADLNINEFKSLMGDILKEHNDNETLLNTQQAADFIGLPLIRFRYLVRSLKIAPIKKKGYKHNLFKIKDLQTYLQDK